MEPLAPFAARLGTPTFSTQAPIYLRSSGIIKCGDVLLWELQLESVATKVHCSLLPLQSVLVTSATWSDVPSVFILNSDVMHDTNLYKWSKRYPIILKLYYLCTFVSSVIRVLFFPDYVSGIFNDEKSRVAIETLD